MPQYTQSDATSEIPVPTTDVQRTSSGRCRAANMMTSALTNGAHVMIERMGSLLIIQAAHPNWTQSSRTSSPTATP